jgi:hypothetical protein
MKQETIRLIKKDIAEFLKVWAVLCKQYNPLDKNGFNSTYPYMTFISVLLGNARAISGSAEEQSEEFFKVVNILKVMNKYHRECYITHYAYTEIDMIVQGHYMSEDYNIE